MDAAPRYFLGAVVESTSIAISTEAVESLWIAPFWASAELQEDEAFDNERFRTHCKVQGSNFRSVPCRRHSKNPFESKHRVIRDVYLRLVPSNPNLSHKTLILQALRVSNDLMERKLLQLKK